MRNALPCGNLNFKLSSRIVQTLLKLWILGGQYNSSNLFGTRSFSLK